MSFIYQYSDLKDHVNSMIHNKIGLVSNVRTLINNAVTEVAMLKLSSMKREAALSPNLFNDIYRYTSPTDLAGSSIRGFRFQKGNRAYGDTWKLTSEDEFDQRKNNDESVVAISERNGIKTLLLSKRVEDSSVVLANMNSLTSDGSGTWAAFGTASTVATDSVDYVNGSGAVSFALSASSGTTAGIENTANTSIDLTNYLNYGIVFGWVKIFSVTNITNYKVRIGSDSSNYYEVTATTQSDGTAFVAGWNQVSFNMSSKTTTGSPVAGSCDYFAVFMTKTTGKVSESGYAFDNFSIKTGVFTSVLYYSNCPWQTSSGTYITRSTEDTDYLVAGEEEWPVILEKAVEVVGRAAREYNDSKIAADNYKVKSRLYKMSNPDESLRNISTVLDIQNNNKKLNKFW